MGDKDLGRDPAPAGNLPSHHPVNPVHPVSGSPELYPGANADAARSAARARAIAQANADPLPGPLLDAFAHVPETIFGPGGTPLTIRPLVAYDFVILRKLDSPLLAQLAKAADPSTLNPQPSTTFPDESAYEMILQFTRPIRDSVALIAKGRAAFRQTALEQIGFLLGPVEVALLIKAIEREFLRSFSTVVKYSPGQSSGDSGGTVFTPPPAAPAPTTASAGGSNTSAV
jgi:hypothetical protein